MAKIRDVAKRAGVAQSTVSRFLNGTGYVSKESAEKIESAIKEFNYVPNELARNFYHKKGHVVALIIPNVAHPFFGSLTRYIETELTHYGYKMMLCSLTLDEKSELDYLDMLRRHMVDGIITGVHSFDESTYSAVDGPIVAFDKTLCADIPVVHANHVQGGRLGAEVLLNCGCRHVVQIEGSAKVKSPSQASSHECASLLRKNGVKVSRVDTGIGFIEEQVFIDSAIEAFERYPDLDGIYAPDMSALASMRIALERGRRVPQEISIVAYDGTYITEFCSPTITAVVQPLKEIAKEIVRVLIKQIEGEVLEKKKFVLDTWLRLGGSTKC